MSAGDLLHQRQAQSAALRTGSAWYAIEHRKQLFASGLGDDPTVIGHAKDGLIILLVDGDFDGRLAVKLGIVEEVADHATQQRRVSMYGHRPSFHRATVVSCAFLGRERGQVDVLTNVELLGRIEAADQKDLIDELVELGDIFFELRLAFRRRPGKLETEPYARERRPQFM